MLHDESVSRRARARRDRSADGLHVVDLGSGNGVWIGTERVKDVVLRPGQRCSIGSTVFECCEEVPVMAAAAATAATLLVNRSAIDLSELSRPDRTSDAGGRLRRPRRRRRRDRDARPGVHRRRVGGHDWSWQATAASSWTSATLSRKSAKFEVVPQGFLVTDLGGSVGVWRDDQKVTSEVVPPGTHIRLGPRIVVALEPGRSRGRPVACAAPCGRRRRHAIHPTGRCGGDASERRRATTAGCPHHRLSPAPAEPVAGRGDTGGDGATAGDCLRASRQNRASPTPTSVRP